MVTLIVWAGVTIYGVLGLPWYPVTTPDSESYIVLSPSRPPAYGRFLQAYMAVSGAEAEPASLGGLPLLQTGLIAVALLALALQTDRLLGRRWTGAIVVVAVWGHVATYEAMRWVMSEALFLPAALLGLALSMAYARRADLWSLGGATACFALSMLARNAGLALLAIPVVLVLFEPIHPLRRRVLRLGVVGLVAALVLGAGAADYHARFGKLGLGSNSGMSLLGKGLLLMHPAPAQDPVLAEAAQRAVQAREAIAAAPGLMASLRAQAQAYELLRWPSFVPAATAAWPEWRDGDAARQNAIASRIARNAIAADPSGYLVLVARDWLALALMPHLWPPRLAGGDSSHPFFAPCEERPPPRACWAFFAIPLPLPYSALALMISFGGLLASGLALVVTLPRLVRGPGHGLPPAERVMFALTVAVQVTMLATAMFEAGLWRYAIVTNVMNSVLVAWAIHHLTIRRGIRAAELSAAPAGHPGRGGAVEARMTRSGRSRTAVP